MTPPKHFLSLADIQASELRSILDDAHRMKKNRIGLRKGELDKDAPFKGETIALIFEKSSTRTRFSFDMAIKQLGGNSITASSNEMQLGRGETIEDTAKVLSSYLDAIMLRANNHETIMCLAANADIPVINGLTNFNHPCQIMADLLTLEEHTSLNAGQLKNMTLTWVGDGNNVANSFINAAVKFKYKLRLSSPNGYEVKKSVLDAALSQGADIEVIKNPLHACKDTDVVIADTFVSMGDKNSEKRLKDLSEYQVNDTLMNAAAKNSIFLHCLPAHRGEEVTADVIDGPKSVVMREAENRLHAQKSILKWCLNS
ncbi:MAG: ornithine carbamoyltransferase [Hellea sp.]|jgi:ornithine carbamoyltransferase|nr:ornithine carbamoyltransferase [Hellea sp.]MBT3592989.1 ornithine carbamoyltransferase [Hellea sp.]MBT4995281.1 ornithine carbamoyltransferase [Hellea sp.]MDA8888848.1 ornithine carbamoyltransferase [Hellea sp.]MDB4844663.1 ornithine carbamoyltransferase [Hellea sp.]MDC0422484.1 ornithine carbamoyltransferase [Hellea sp.]